jgi:hypothetical protein
MDAISAAVVTIGGQMAVQRLNATVDIFKKSQEMDQGIIDLVASSTGTGTVYDNGGSVQASPVASKLNTQA